MQHDNRIHEVGIQLDGHINCQRHAQDENPTAKAPCHHAIGKLLVYPWLQLKGSLFSR